jgi:hypothetical protein
MMAASFVSFHWTISMLRAGITWLATRARHVPKLTNFFVSDGESGRHAHRDSEQSRVYVPNMDRERRAFTLGKHIACGIVWNKPVALSGAIALSSTAFAASPGTNGQPNQSCQDQPSTPGNAGSASVSGSAFNQAGQAGSVYAGTHPQNTINQHTVSQYDVACFQVSQPQLH